MIVQTMNAVFCLFGEWQRHLPEELRQIPEAEWLARSRGNNWAPYVRINGQRSPAYFKKTDIMVWFQLRYGVVHPDAVQSLIDAGFPEPEQTKA